MDKKNIVVFSQARSGSTAFIEAIYHLCPVFRWQHMRHWPEYLNCIDSLIPFNKDSKWYPECDPTTIGVLSRLYQNLDFSNQYIENGLKEIEKYFEEQKDKFVECIYYTYFKEDKLIKRTSHAWSERSSLNLNSWTNEIHNRIHLLNFDIRPYSFKYFSLHIRNDDWIDRKNTIVIALIRNNTLEKLASFLRARATNYWNHSTTNHQNNWYTKGPNIDIRQSIPDFIPIDKTRIIEQIKLNENHYKRMQLLNPDVIISYETLIKTNILNLTGIRKVTIEPVEIFFKNYTEAKEIVKDEKPIADKNVTLLENILGVSLNE